MFEYALFDKATDMKQHSADFGVKTVGIGVNYGD